MHEEQVSIFALVLAGQTSREIANQLHLEYAQVERVIRATKRQLGAPNRYQAALAIAKHHGRPVVPERDLSQHGPIISQIEPKTMHIAAELADTNHEHIPIFSYVRDVGGAVFSRILAFDANDEFRDRLSFKPKFKTSRIGSTILLITLIIFSGALSLGALISAMLGLDVLIQY